MKKNAFTLVELLVVISIVGILASILLVSFVGTQKQTRDTQRKSDIKQYLTSLENFGSKTNGLYPVESVIVSASSILCRDLSMTNCPSDPKNVQDSSFDYKYQSDGTATGGAPSATQYVLWAKLENTTDYWVVCSSGKLGTVPQSGFSISGGNCPSSL